MVGRLASGGLDKDGVTSPRHLVNHSCEPNVAFDLSSKDMSQWHVRALRPIKAGDPCELEFSQLKNVTRTR